MSVRVCVTVQGRVQGVAFRQHTRHRAVELGVTGWVKNLPDGAVEGLFEGSDAAVQSLVDWCRTGPPAARVDRLDLRIVECSGEFDTFTITY